MPKYAEWDDVQYGGRTNRIVKKVSRQSRLILEDCENSYKVYDQDGPIWIPKQYVTVVEKDENTQVRNNISENTVDSEC